MSASIHAASVARRLVNAAAGDRVRVVRVMGGVARGRRVALNLTFEKAYWFGRYERPLQAFLRTHVGPGDVFFDVGAHIGFFSVCAAALGARVIAVEPDASNAARVRRNAQLTGLDIAVVEAAAWNEAGTVRLLHGPSAKEHVTAPGEGVASVTLDDLAARYGMPTVMKLDVEGAETRALEGARGILGNGHSIVVCELHGEEQREGVARLLAGYDVVELASRYRIAAMGPAR